jgi:hypothetical protein
MLLAGLIALTALAAAVLLAISLAPASAETPAERCKRETTAYNNAWKNSWAASHPGKKPSDAPKPPVPSKCGSNNDGPPPTITPTTSAPPEETVGPTTSAPESNSDGPSMNAPTERRELEHPDSGQKPIGNPSDTDLSSTTAEPGISSSRAEKSDPLKDAVSNNDHYVSGAYEQNCNDSSGGARLVMGEYESAFSFNRKGYCVLDISDQVVPDRDGLKGGCQVTSPSQGCTAGFSETVTTSWTGGVGFTKIVQASLSYTIQESRMVTSSCTFQPGAPAGTRHDVYPMVRKRTWLVWDAKNKRQPGEWDGVTTVVSKEPTGQVLCQSNGVSK